MRILFDTNVLLDALLSREPFVADAASLMMAAEAGQIQGFISATTITDIYYLVRRETKNKAIADAAIAGLLKLTDICPVNRSILEQAIQLQLPDFEDAVQISCAMTHSLDAIVTRDVKGFTGSSILALSPEALKNQLNLP
jgi:predicted nucleic acid-binding protein